MERRPSNIWLIIVAGLFIVVPFLTWYFTWFGRNLSEQDLATYLADEKNPRHIQHALLQIEQRIESGDQSARKFYPQIVAASKSSVPEVRKTALLYGAIGIFHFLFRKKFLTISMNHAKAEQSGIHVRFWDFLFYASFGFVVTSSVAIAGVLLVFCYLIVPSVGAMLFADRIGPRLAIGWTMGTLVSALGCYLSVQLDTPTGATIVVTFGAILVLMFFMHLIVHRGRATQGVEGAASAHRELEAAASSKVSLG